MGCCFHIGAKIAAPERQVIAAVGGRPDILHELEQFHITN